MFRSEGPSGAEAQPWGETLIAALEALRHPKSWPPESGPPESHQPRPHQSVAASCTTEPLSKGVQCAAILGAALSPNLPESV